MQRQAWIFLDDSDAATLVDRLRVEDGIRTLSGRFFKGSDERLRSAPESLETKDLTAGEHWIHLIHPAFSGNLTVHEVPDGPLAGWRKLDEVRSEVITLVRQLPGAGGMAPSRLVSHSHAWFGGEKLRKSPEFTTWMAAVFKRVEAAYPTTAFDWIRVGPGARALGDSGVRLHYLFREVPIQRTTTTPYRPHGK